MKKLEIVHAMWYKLFNIESPKAMGRDSAVLGLSGIQCHWFGALLRGKDNLPRGSEGAFPGFLRPLGG